MKFLNLAPVNGAISVLLVLAAARGEANPWPNGFPSAPPPNFRGMNGMHRFHGGGFLILEEPEVIVEREVVREKPPEQPAPPAPPPPPRKPYVIGRTYSSLPGGCMKLIDHGTSYFRCSGEWYREVGDGRNGPYLAVAQP
jgi:hypothetical protein